MVRPFVSGTFAGKEIVGKRSRLGRVNSRTGTCKIEGRNPTSCHSGHLFWHVLVDGPISWPTTSLYMQQTMRRTVAWGRGEVAAVAEEHRFLCALLAVVRPA